MKPRQLQGFTILPYIDSTCIEYLTRTETQGLASVLTLGSPVYNGRARRARPDALTL